MKKPSMRVITTKKGIPEDTVSAPGFYAMNMGTEGMWLVDLSHPGYAGCVKKAIQLAEKDGRDKDAELYRGYPKAALQAPKAQTEVKTDGKQKEVTS